MKNKNQNKKTPWRNFYIDRNICTGCGNCAQIAPEVFSLDAEGICQIDSNKINNNLEKVLEAAQSCPALAIIIDDDRHPEIYK